jgi:hypothetical protein
VVFKKRLVPRTQSVLDATGYRVGKIIQVFVIHLFEQRHELLNRLKHCVDLLVGASATFAIQAIVGAFAVAWFEFHFVLPPGLVMATRDPWI